MAPRLGAICGIDRSLNGHDVEIGIGEHFGIRGNAQSPQAQFIRSDFPGAIMATHQFVHSIAVISNPTTGAPARANATTTGRPT